MAEVSKYDIYEFCRELDGMERKASRIRERLEELESEEVELGAFDREERELFKIVCRLYIGPPREKTKCG